MKELSASCACWSRSADRSSARCGALRSPCRSTPSCSSSCATPASSRAGQGSTGSARAMSSSRWTARTKASNCPSRWRPTSSSWTRASGSERPPLRAPSLSVTREAGVHNPACVTYSLPSGSLGESNGEKPATGPPHELPHRLVVRVVTPVHLCLTLITDEPACERGGAGGTFG
ncbi:hypothetical protein MIPYR_10103 [uncultured Microbacterium sp.]|uniref:Uncharacterized protein n=1 Tax=uncultured Microbacterium sp. TaxID=191216 RepID=A0A1Y5NU36_9MICO|nr:hypothetical protein MIPYR_10103 [uncultured Microbacterium sp.]